MLRQVRRDERADHAGPPTSKTFIRSRPSRIAGEARHRRPGHDRFEPLHDRAAVGVDEDRVAPGSSSVWTILWKAPAGMTRTHGPRNGVSVMPSGVGPFRMYPAPARRMMYSSTSGWRWTSTNSGGGRAVGVDPAAAAGPGRPPMTNRLSCPVSSGRTRPSPSRGGGNGRMRTIGSASAGVSPTNRAAVGPTIGWTRPFAGLDRLGFDHRDVGEGRRDPGDDLHLDRERLDDRSRDRVEAGPVGRTPGP